MKIETKYEILQKVKIVPLDNMSGRIIGFYYLNGVMTYWTRYFVNAEEKREYFYEDELVLAE